MTPSLHPLYLILAAVFVVTGLYFLHDRAPILMPCLLAASLIAIAVRAWLIARERRRRRDSRAVIDFEALRHKDAAGWADWLKLNVRGHDAVVERLIERLQQNLMVASPHRTLGAFLLVGPTGTGKTFLAELLAKVLHPGTDPVVLRMNQYKDHQDVFTLLGPPPGQPGYEVGGALTRPVLDNPHRVIILDEFEKCHPDIKHCLYDVLDRGQCSEKSSGRTAHFGACAFFATCNGGVESLRGIWADTKDPAVRAARARDAMAREGFEKALLARFDDIFLMDQLKAVDIAEIACLQLAKHWRQYGIEISYASPEVIAEALQRNREFQEYGVRQLARLIQDLTTPSIEAARKSGAQRVRLDLDAATGRVLVTEAHDQA